MPDLFPGVSDPGRDSGHKKIFLVIMTDPIAQMLTEIKNALAAHHPELEVPFSKLKYEIAKILVKKGFLEKAEKVGKAHQARIRIHLDLSTTPPPITDFKRISRPSRRLYVKAREIPLVMQGKGLAVISTPRGVMSGEEARKQNLGGELLFTIW